MDTRQSIEIGKNRLEGLFGVPDNASGLIIFAHGSGSSRHSPRNNYVADILQSRGFATLLFDLLSEEEAVDRRNVFDIPRLGDRVGQAITWAATEPQSANLPIGLFGASTGAAAALVAAAAAPTEIRAVVSRGGRPDLAGSALPHVKAPTLLIIGGLDDQVVELNAAARSLMQCETKLEIVPGATHLFEEAGTLDLAVDLASDWFSFHCRIG